MVGTPSFSKQGDGNGPLRSVLVSCLVAAGRPAPHVVTGSNAHSFLHQFFTVSSARGSVHVAGPGPRRSCGARTKGSVATPVLKIYSGVWSNPTFRVLLLKFLI